MATSDQKDDVFKYCVEEPESNPSHAIPKDEKHGGDQSSPAQASDDGLGSAGSPQTPLSQQIQEKYQVVCAEHAKKRYVACREKCMDLLRERNLPPITRCLTLQLFASCSYYYGAKIALEQALIIAKKLGDLDSDKEIRKHVEKLLQDLEEYRPKEGAPRPFIKELEYDDNGEDKK